MKAIRAVEAGVPASLPVRVVPSGTCRPKAIVAALRRADDVSSKNLE